MPKLVSDILLLTFIFGVIAIGVYALLLQPRRAAFKKRVQYVADVKPGTRVHTYGGLVGTITHVDMDDGTARLQIADGVEVTILAAAIMGEFDREAIVDSVQKGLK